MSRRKNSHITTMPSISPRFTTTWSHWRAQETTWLSWPFRTPLLSRSRWHSLKDWLRTQSTPQNTSHKQWPRQARSPCPGMFSCDQVVSYGPHYVIGTDRNGIPFPRFLRTAITKKIGQLFIMRINVNLVSNILDTPEIFWSEPSLQPLYSAIRGNGPLVLDTQWFMNHKGTHVGSNTLLTTVIVRTV